MSDTINHQHYRSLSCTADHVGNNRVVVSEDGVIEQVVHYYPFGGQYADAGLNLSAQQYKHGGKELDPAYGLDWHDFGARPYYDPSPHGSTPTPSPATTPGSPPTATAPTILSTSSILLATPLFSMELLRPTPIRFKHFLAIKVTAISNYILKMVKKPGWSMMKAFQIVN